ncbi:hypothetical protein Vqi01_31530 [Micromonospora qiuiae]|uniref:Uncharacterized protein n=1 Tax=Micromonospora qiuiae TaxID=502268 RepID=A0ABQ4JCT5_9ACTN|nr:hypothetical protein Vqi01_31530 [Micromonospora qiuiae]
MSSTGTECGRYGAHAKRPRPVDLARAAPTGAALKTDRNSAEQDGGGESDAGLVGLARGCWRTGGQVDRFTWWRADLYASRRASAAQAGWPGAAAFRLVLLPFQSGNK